MVMEEKKKRQVNQVAETGHTVAANIKRLRGTMQYKQLAEKLSEVGRPIAELGLRKIESGERKVDVDDLMAFAIVFGVSPLTLLMPEYGSSDITTRITGYPDQVGTNVAWLWARGDEPLEVPQDPALTDHAQTDRAIALFRLHSVPTIDPRCTITPVAGWVPSDSNAAAEQTASMMTETFELSRAQLVRPDSSER